MRKFKNSRSIKRRYQYEKRKGAGKVAKNGCDTMAIKEDVSNSTIAVLLVLTILVSVVGTWTVLDKTKQKLDQNTAVTGLAVEEVQEVQNEVDEQPVPPVETEEAVNEEIIYKEDEEDKEDNKEDIQPGE
ncbi:TPA: hypothetical protein HA297_02420 [Candidatus Woesearchaeota archaeon]|nr:hypothetical protein [Candidatus Woesearchaeota archaeon]HII89351.1 hypothetical protein [Candidatus Woesearchaeota archaeon]